MKMNCKFCGTEKKNLNSLVNHERLCKSNPNRQETYTEKCKKGGIRPAFYDLPEYKEKMRLAGIKGRNALPLNLPEETKNKISKKLKVLNNTPEYKKEQSARMKEVVKNNPNSYSKKNVSGRVKNIEYEGYIFKGSWELEVGKFLLKNNIKFEQPENPIPYFWNNDWHLYFPDFYLPAYDKFIEVKGFERDRDLAKWAVMKNLIVIKYKEIKLIKEDKFNISILTTTEK
jgi:hypothetical protein